MSEMLSPGVFIEELPAQVQVVQAVSTSNLGIVGFTKRGPTDVATLVTSYEQFTREFGGLSRDSLLPIEMAAYFANGGKRAFVVRVTPSDAAKAAGLVTTRAYSELIGTGDDNATSFSGVFAKVPEVEGTVAVRWRGAGVTPLVPANIRNRADTADLVLSNSVTSYEGRLPAGGLPTFDPEQASVVPGSVTLEYTLDGPGLLSFAVPSTYPTAAVSIGNATNGGTLLFDHCTSRFSLTLWGAYLPDPLLDLGIVPTVAYTPASETASATDDGVGGWLGDVMGAGAVVYSSGTYQLMITAGKKPHLGAPILAAYTANAWALTAVSKGVWGDDLKIQVFGSPDYYSASLAAYTRFSVNVRLLNSATGIYEVVETHEDLDFSDPTALIFWADMVNELSDYVKVTEPGNVVEAPAQLAGQVRTMALAAGDLSVAGKTVTGNLPLSGGSISPRSVSIRYTDSAGVAKTITDDGNGHLVGAVDGTGVNTVVYTTGAVSFKTTGTIQKLTFVLANYYLAPAATSDTSAFSAGLDGTFGTSTWSRDQFTNPTLKPGFLGLYALSKVEEVMQVAIPDWAGDVTVTSDLLDYVDERAAQPQGGDRFAIICAPKGSTAQEAIDWLRYSLARYCKFAAMYWPWVQIADPMQTGRIQILPPHAHVAGIYARTDQTRNVGKAPGGTVDGALKFLLGLEMVPTLGERDAVYQARINSLVSSVQTGLAVWGVRTIASESEWRYINIRRLFMFLEKSVFNSTHWVAFENNGPALWARIKAQLGGFFMNLYNERYFAGTRPSDAFYIICDESNNSQASIDAGQVIIDIGAAGNKPAEFIRFRFAQSTL
jgi:phage tail sheath protein FI